MTKHADRDHSEKPATYAVGGPVTRPLDWQPSGCAYWPPTATREPRVRFPLDDGDTGAALLPVAPAGTLLRCPVCPAALADTRGGRLDHCDDGSHHYVPAQPVERQLYRFWAKESGHVDQEGVGWWRSSARVWVAIFGDGTWSSDFVTRWEPLAAEAAP